MLLITELTETIQFLKETAEDGAKKYFIEGIIMQGNIKNRNGRIYPTEILSQEVQRYTEEYINRNKAYGELDHPTTPTVSLERASHMFTDLRVEGNDVVGRARIMTSLPMGKIAAGLIEEGANLGISSRGLGAVKKNSAGIMEVAQFRLQTPGDLVADPSGPNCYVQGIMEGVEFYFDVASQSWEQKALQVVEEHIEEIHNNYKQIDEAKAFLMFNQFLESLKNS
jgi:hypothetical protein